MEDKRPVDVDELIDALTGDSAPFDPLGSYTGTPEDGEKPVQDADDL